MFAQPCRTFRDPVHGDVRLPLGVVCDLIDTVEFQRLRRIRQLGMCYTTFPGAEHSRFSHTLGVCWLAYQTLRNWSLAESTQASEAELVATLCAALLHDVGHGPFSHALEHVFAGIDHEQLGAELIRTRFRPTLDRHGVEPELVIAILSGTHSRPSLHELISGQLDVDRMDYLQRDSLFSGTPYGKFDSQRILASLTPIFDVQRGSEVLALESKAVEAVEAFLFCRHFMHWQVYFHRTVRAGEFLLRSILERARQLSQERPGRLNVPGGLRFLFQGVEASQFLSGFVDSDDSDLLHAVKVWAHSDDSLLADLCGRLAARRFPKVLESSDPEHEEAVRTIVQRRFPQSWRFMFGVDRPSDQGVESEDRPLRVLTGRGSQWLPLRQVTRTRALDALGQPLSQTFLLYPPECRDEVVRLQG